MAGESSEEETYDDLEGKQRLKAALHYTIGQICTGVKDVTFTKEFIATLTETAFKECEALSTDLELFAKHAKRTTVNTDDVKLYCRRNPDLLGLVTKKGEQLKADKDEVKKKSKGKGKAPAIDEDD